MSIPPIATLKAATETVDVGMCGAPKSSPFERLKYNQRSSRGAMVKPGTALPKKLKCDAIVEALLEWRFESKGLWEVFLGRFADHRNWKGWAQRTLPAYSLPPQLR